jgi:membrane fusion protein (multidrug efflux system)
MTLIEGKQKAKESERAGRARSEAESDRARAEKSPQRESEQQQHESHESPDIGGRMRAARESVRRHPYIAAIAIIAITAALIGGLVWWLNVRQYESTDDAFIDTRTVPISAQIAGAIVDVPVTDNQLVAAGAPLVRIDPRDYQAAVEQTQAQLEQAQASVTNFEAQISAQQASIDQAEKQAAQAQAALQFSQQENDRSQALLQRGAGTVQTAQQTSSDLRQKTAAFSGAQSSVVAAQKQLTVLQAQLKSARAQVDAARAALDKARIDLARATIQAPESGRVAKLTAANGAYAQPGQALMNLVPENVWVTANFKETQLTGMRKGQPVDIEVDAYPGRTFHGHVDSIQAGSGTAFSLLPPENATGNFVKIVQRVPVKIVFDAAPGVYLGPGMSVVPSVKVR